MTSNIKCLACKSDNLMFSGNHYKCMNCGFEQNIDEEFLINEREYQETFNGVSFKKENPNVLKQNECKFVSNIRNCPKCQSDNIKKETIRNKDICICVACGYFALADEFEPVE